MVTKHEQLRKHASTGVSFGPGHVGRLKPCNPQGALVGERSGGREPRRAPHWTRSWRQPDVSDCRGEAQDADPRTAEGCDPEQHWRWAGSELGEPVPAADPHVSQRYEWTIVSDGADTTWLQRTVRSVSPDEEQVSETAQKDRRLTAPPSCVPFCPELGGRW